MALSGAKYNASLRVLGNIFSEESRYQQSVLGVQTDATLDPGATPSNGDRYILTDTGALNANFGTITGVGNGDIVEYDGSDFVIVWDASVQGEGATTYDLDSSAGYTYNGTAWVSADHPDGGDGITYNGGSDRFDLDLADTAPGLELTAADGSGELRLFAQGNGIAGGAGSLLSVDPATEVAGSRAAIYLGADGVGIDLDDSTLTHATSTLQIKDGGVDTTQLADAGVTVAKIEVLAEGELIVGNGTANSKVATASVGDILSDETNGLTIKADAVSDDELDYAGAGLRSGAATDAFSASLTRTFTHSWSTTNVMVEIFDSVTGETVMVDEITRASNSVAITVNQQPVNSLTVLLREVNGTQTSISVS